jgi:hypothetical protein
MDFIKNELDKNKFFVVRYATVFNVLVLVCTILFLFLIRIERISILSMILEYYFK